MYKGSNRDKIKKPPIEALDDTEIPTAIRFKIESYVYKNYVKIENQYIPAKGDILKMLFAGICKGRYFI